jgi:hypothetical protein
MLHTTLSTAMILLAGRGLWPAPAGPEAVRLGITPEVTLVAGFSVAQAETGLARLGNAAPQIEQVHVAWNSVHARAAALADLIEQLSEEPTNATLAAQVAATRQQLVSARQQVHEAQAILVGAVVAGMPGGPVQRLAVARAGSRRRTPPEFWAIERTEQQWRALESAVVIERRAARTGGSVPPEVASLLAQARSHPAVVEATQALGTHLPAMRTVFAP